MHQHIQLLGLEAGQLPAEVGEAREGVALDEVLLQVEEGPLHLALAAGPAPRAGDWLSAGSSPESGRRPPPWRVLLPTLPYRDSNRTAPAGPVGSRSAG